MSDSPPPAEAVADLPDLQHATVSPDGTRIACYYSGTGSTEIHVLDLGTGDLAQWTDGDAGDTAIWPLAWTADGERVLFHRDDGDGAEQYDVYAVDADGAVERVLETDGSTQLRDVGADGETLLVRSTHGGGMDAYLASLPSGDLTRLTDREGPVYRPVLGPDAERVAYPADGGIAVCDRTGSVQRVLGVGDEGSVPTPVDWGPDGDRLLVSDDATGVDRVGVYDLAGDDVTWLGEAEYVERPTCFLPDGRRVVALRDRDALTVPVVYDAETGDSREFDLPEGVAYLGRNPHRVVSDDRLLVGHATPTRPRRLLEYDLASDEYEVVLEPDTGPFEPGDFVDPAFEYVASDGVPETRQAAVEHDPYETFDVGTLFYDSGERPSSLVVFPHGGPAEADRRTFRSRVQFLCRRGYSVLQVNYRGSTGRGQAFREALYGDWGGAEQGDVATAVEHALDAHDFLDEDRVAVYGGSFGGFSAYWQLVQYPELYTVGAAVVGMTDLRDMYENTVPQFRAGFLETHLGTPEAHPDLYEQRSPVTHVANLNSALLVVHGENDPRVPVSQARRFRDALDAEGYAFGEDGQVEYHELSGSGHWSSGSGVPRPLALLDDFLDRRL
jgi:dipeptidyl aminopeptidase/acylaminoacyl peptidase